MLNCPSLCVDMIKRNLLSPESWKCSPSWLIESIWAHCFEIYHEISISWPKSSMRYHFKRITYPSKNQKFYIFWEAPTFESFLPLLFWILLSCAWDKPWISTGSYKFYQKKNKKHLMRTCFSILYFMIIELKPYKIVISSNQLIWIKIYPKENSRYEAVKNEL